MCQDQSISYLNAIGYNMVSLPREQFEPLMIFGGPPSDLQYLGGLSDLFLPGAPSPQIQRDDPAAEVVGHRSNRLESSVGFNLVGRLLGAFGGTGANASAGYSNAAAVQLVFLNVFHDFVAPLQIGNYIRSAQTQPGSLDMVRQYERVYIITDTLKSNQFGIIAYGKEEEALEVSADAIQDILGAKGNVKITNQADNVVCYTGEKQLRFGFRALGLSYDQKSAMLKLDVDHRFLVARAAMEPQSTPFLPPEMYELLAVDELIDIRFGR